MDTNKLIWVIEKDSPALYFQGFDYGAGKWTPNFEDALRFSSKESAQLMWDADAPIFTTYNEARICDHFSACGVSQPEKGDK